ncbi:MAG: serine/threonine protein kinase [Myxococcales bacterium]|nr:serine/threonine protein kinase [Myxococcales bacterium]
MSGDRQFEIPEVIGRYRVRELAGFGAHAFIYAAWDEERERMVAIKLLRDTGMIRPDQRSRFLREAKALSRLDHPNVVHIYEVGVHEGRSFLAMELVEGRSLRAWQKESPRSTNEILRAYLDAGRGLAAAHAAGLMHRDFKPDNVMVGDDGRVRVADFGLARSTRGTDSFQTIENMTPGLAAALEAGPDLLATVGVSGTPAYMALEQHFGRRTDARADQFAFCVALWEALFGQRPYAGRTAGEIARAIEKGALVAPLSGSEVSRKLRKVLERGLAAEPDDRWPNLEPIIEEIAASLADKGLLARLFKR